MKKKLLLVGAGLLWATTALSSVQAATDVQKVIDETYVQPEYVLGASLSETQKNQTLQSLGYNATNDTKEIKTMTTQVYSKIMNVADDASLQLYSSAKIQKLGNNDPLKVTIVTPQNITKVTQDMYRNAAVTLGVEHAEITVASPIPVTGESALAGIYYSLEANGATVPQENKELAQEELATLSGINDANKDKEGYDADKLNVALADIKSGIAKAKESKKELTEEDIRKIVEDTLKNYKLDQVITGNQINLLLNFAVNLSKSELINNSDFVQTLDKLKDSIVAQAGDTFKNINLDFDANKALEDGGNFLSSLWKAIVEFFRGIFG